VLPLFLGNAVTTSHIATIFIHIPLAGDPRTCRTSGIAVLAIGLSLQLHRVQIGGAVSAMAYLSSQLPKDSDELLDALVRGSSSA
jgi:hypothetical protein